MQFQKKTRPGNFNSIIKIFIKLFIIIIIAYALIIFVDKINFPAPNKQIEKKIPNENFKVIK